MTNQSLSSTFKRNIFLTKIIAINAPLKYTIAIVSKIFQFPKSKPVCSWETGILLSPAMVYFASGNYKLIMN